MRECSGDDEGSSDEDEEKEDDDDNDDDDGDDDDDDDEKENENENQYLNDYVPIISEEEKKYLSSHIENKNYHSINIKIIIIMIIIILTSLNVRTYRLN